MEARGVEPRVLVHGRVGDVVVEEAHGEGDEAEEEVEAAVDPALVERRAAPRAVGLEVEENEGEDDVLEEAVDDDLGHAAVVLAAVVEEERLQEPELRDREIRVVHGLAALLAADADADAWLKAVYWLYMGAPSSEKEAAWWHAVMTSHTIDHVAETTTEEWTYYGPYVHDGDKMRHVNEVIALEKAANASSGSGGADGTSHGSSSSDMATSSSPPTSGGSSTPGMAVGNN